MNNFYLTFGQRYRRELHPAGALHRFGSLLPDGWVRIIAEDEDQARLIALAHFGNAWAFLYEAEDFEPDYLPVGELMAIGGEQ